MYWLENFYNIFKNIALLIFVNVILLSSSSLLLADEVPDGERDFAEYDTSDSDKRKALDNKISYYVLQQSVGSAMKDIGAQINIPVIVASSVQGKVAAGKYKGTAREVLNQLASDSSTHWYFDGRAIQVTNVKDAVMHVVELKGFSYKSLLRTLYMMRLDIKGFPIRHDYNNNLVVIYGPPKYVATVEIVAHNLANQARRKPSVIRG